MLPCPQAPRAVVMIRGHRFCPNPLTALDNAFQATTRRSPAEVAEAAYAEVTAAAEAIRAAGVAVHLFDDPEASRPDSVFPNNWFTTHLDGRIVLYPMYAANRRTERRTDVIDALAALYQVSAVVDYSPLEAQELFLEGTGAMVLDHVGRTAFVARSLRAHPDVLARFTSELGFTPCVFDAVDDDGIPIYHTNVMMAVGTELAIASLDLIRDPSECEQVASLLRAEGQRDLIELTAGQIGRFAGNVLELDAGDHRVLAMSTTAAASLTRAQRTRIEASCEILALSVPTIELAGGSVRCMLAGVHLEPLAVPPIDPVLPGDPVLPVAAATTPSPVRARNQAKEQSQVKEEARAPQPH